MKKRIKIVALTVVALLISTMLFACSPDNDSHDIVVTLLHTNDTHSRVYEDSSTIDIAQIATVKKSIENSILVDVGDTIHGLPHSLINEGRDIVDAMNAAEYDLVTLGNHEFNFGLETLFDLEKAADFNFISSNIAYGELGLLFTSTYIQQIDGLNIGFFALTTYQTEESTKMVYPKLKFLDYETSAKTAIEELKEVGVDAVVGLAHISREETKTLVPKIKDDVSVIIDAHDHIKTNETADGVLIASAGEFRQNLGKVELTFDSKTKEVKSKTASLITKANFADVKHDGKTATVVNRIRAIEDIEYGKVVATSTANFAFEYETVNGWNTAKVRFEETLIGNFVCDAILKATGSDIAFVNGGNIRAGISTGSITKKDVVSILPFNNYLEERTVTIPQLIEILKHSVKQRYSGGFLQVGGLKYTAAYETDGSGNIINVEITSITVGATQLNLSDTTTTFTVAVNSYLASGGDGYAMFSQTVQSAIFGIDIEMLIREIQSKQAISTSDAILEGRIRFTVR